MECKIIATKSENFQSLNLGKILTKPSGPLAKVRFCLPDVLAKFSSILHTVMGLPSSL